MPDSVWRPPNVDPLLKKQGNFGFLSPPFDSGGAYYETRCIGESKINKFFRCERNNGAAGGRSGPDQEA